MGELMNREAILAQINVVREPLRQIYMCSTQISELQEKNEKVKVVREKKEKMSAFTTPVIFFVVACYIVGMAYMCGIFTLYNLAISIAVNAGIAVFILWISYSDKSSTIKRYLKQEKELTDQIREWEIRRETIARPIIESVKVIPPDYQYSLATEYIYSCILNQRAATIGEAVNLYEDQLHKWKMEQMQSKLLEIGVQQQYTLNKIKQADTISAAANVATAVLAGMR